MIARIARVAFVFGLCAAMLSVAGAASATAISLTDDNSTVTLYPNSSGGTSAGVESWTVDGVNQLARQWFWYRVGSGTASSIDTLGSGTVSISPTVPNYATVTYAGNGLQITVGYTLRGGNWDSGTADLAENIAIKNTTRTSETVNFFQYSNFVLQGSDSASGDYVQFQNSNAVDQWKEGSSEALSETVITPKPNYREAAYVGKTVNELETMAGYQLKEANVNFPPSQTVGAGDVTWAYEWDKTILPGSTFFISKDKVLSGVTPLPGVPEPSTLTLVLAGLLTLVGLARRRA